MKTNSKLLFTLALATMLSSGATFTASAQTPPTPTPAEMAKLKKEQDCKELEGKIKQAETNVTKSLENYNQELKNPDLNIAGTTAAAIEKRKEAERSRDMKKAIYNTTLKTLEDLQKKAQALGCGPATGALPTIPGVAGNNSGNTGAGNTGGPASTLSGAANLTSGGTSAADKAAADKAAADKAAADKAAQLLAELSKNGAITQLGSTIPYQQITNPNSDPSKATKATTGSGDKSTGNTYTGAIGTIKATNPTGETGMYPSNFAKVNTPTQLPLTPVANIPHGQFFAPTGPGTVQISDACGADGAAAAGYSCVYDATKKQFLVTGFNVITIPPALVPAATQAGIIPTQPAKK